MEAGSTRPRLWPLPGPGNALEAIDRGHPRLAAVATWLALAALVPAFILLAPDSTWEPQALFTLLLVFGFTTEAAAHRVRPTISVDATVVVALVALAFLGPLPAAVIAVAPEVGSWLSGRRAFLGAVSNVVSFGWAALVGSLLLEALVSEPPLEPVGIGDYVAIAGTGVVFLYLNYAIGRTLIARLRDGNRLRALLKYELLPTFPLELSLLAVGVLTTFLYEQFGTAGLAPLAGVLLLPQVLSRRFLTHRPVAELQRSDATALYAQAIADELGCDRGKKRVLGDAATYLGGSASLTQVEDFQSVMHAVLYRYERWDGDGGSPGVLFGEEIPFESRVLAVADAWSALTASGTEELSPEKALYALKARAGTELDPHVVAAAVKVVEEQTLPAPTST